MRPPSATMQPLVAYDAAPGGYEAVLVSYYAARVGYEAPPVSYYAAWKL